MSDQIEVCFKDGSGKQITRNTSCLELVNEEQQKYKYKIIAAKINNDLVEINEKIVNPCTIEFLDLSSSDGNEVYVRGLKYLFIKAVKDVLGYPTKIMIEHSIDKGIYCEIMADINENIIKNIEDRMKQIVSQNMSIDKLNVSRKEAIEYFNNIGRSDKGGTLDFMTQGNITLYRLDNLYDYFFGPMPISTGYIDRFALTFIAPRGVVLRYPTIYSPDVIPEYVHHEKILEVFKEYNDWGKNVGINSVVDLNNKIMNGLASEVIKISELNQNNKLYKIAEDIYNKKNIKIVLIGGPSSSGKTTLSHKLSLYLKNMGFNPEPIGLDDYYVNRVDTPRDENGEYDYESIDAIDINLFNDHLTRLLNGEEVDIPRYNFITGEKEFNNRKLRLKENDILIIEGLHGLNEKLTSSISRANKYKIYISPLTALNIDDHNRIPTSLVRKLRRIVRDHQFRGYEAIETMEQWKKVRLGEEKYVFPFQDDADIVFNTALIYELSVLKVYVEPLLFSIKEDSEYYNEARRIIRFLDLFLPITTKDIPQDSILREFIGDSYFKGIV
ncbi:MAG: nucleoside kinase [Bacilli bacterium]|jgi:uridine kinase